MHDIHQILKQYWGFDKYRPLQEDIIHSVISGKDTLALLPTGGGKSICFQVPGLVMDGLCLVISPLIALMKDQVANLQKKGIKAAAVFSGLSYREIETLLDNCTYGNYKFLYISPERLITDDFRLRLKNMKINLFAVDEAHCISQWGYDFRPPYLKIAEVREQLPKVPVIALTATATHSVIEDIQTKLLFHRSNVFRRSFIRHNLSYVVRQTINKEQSLLDILTKVPGSAIVYVRNRKRTKSYSDYLNKHSITSDYYHAGLTPDERSRKQDIWLTGKKRVICCTNAFGMGIDKPDVRLVVHLDLPDSPEAYFQEAGRAGRDEKKAYAVLLIGKADLPTLKEKLNDSYPPLDFIKDVYHQLGSELRIAYHHGMNESFDFAVGSFSATHQWNPIRVLSALRILEQQEMLYMTDGVYSRSQIKVKADKSILYKFQVENKTLEPIIKFILRTSEGIFEDYVPIDEATIASRLKLPMEEVLKQLHILDQHGIFIYLPRKNNPQIIFLQPRWKRDELRLNVDFINARRKEYELRLKAIENYVTENHTCRTTVLVRYFGEVATGNCGICDVCVARKKSGLEPTEFSNIVKEVGDLLRTNAITSEALSQQLKIKLENIDTVMEYLLDAGKIERTEEGAIRWIP